MKDEPDEQVEQVEHDEYLAGVITLQSGQNVEKNLEQAFAYMERGARIGAKILVLPEMFAYIGPYAYLKRIAEEHTGGIRKRLAEFARTHGLLLVAGTLPVSTADDQEQRVQNVQYVYSPDGSEIARYAKTHLFSLTDANGTKVMAEEKGFLAGDQLARLDYQGLNLALSTCYDVRFSELYQRLAQSTPIDIITVPSAFTEGTGKDHWEVLLRARAIEFQSYVLAPNQWGEHGFGKRSYGHSMIIDPWGSKLCDTGPTPGLALASVSRSRLAEVRQTLGVRADRRQPLYRGKICEFSAP